MPYRGAVPEERVVRAVSLERNTRLTDLLNPGFPMHIRATREREIAATPERVSSCTLLHGLGRGSHPAPPTFASNRSGSPVKLGITRYATRPWSARVASLATGRLSADFLQSA